MARPDTDVLAELISSLKQQRDELQVRMHLAQAEAKQECGRLTDQIDRISDQYKPVQEAASESAGNVVAALTLAAEELQTGVHRVLKTIADS